MNLLDIPQGGGAHGDLNDGKTETVHKIIRLSHLFLQLLLSQADAVIVQGAANKQTKKKKPSLIIDLH